MGMVT